MGANLNQFTKRSASSGSLYAYVAKGLGPDVGVVAGWALVLAYILTASAVLCGFVNYANVLFDYAGISIPPVLTAIVGAAGAWFLAFKDIKLSTKIMLVLEVISVSTDHYTCYCCISEKWDFVGFWTVESKRCFNYKYWNWTGVSVL